MKTNVESTEDFPRSTRIALSGVSLGESVIEQIHRYFLDKGKAIEARTSHINGSHGHAWQEAVVPCPAPRS